jgi:hypothetical protein
MMMASSRNLQLNVGILKTPITHSFDFITDKERGRHMKKFAQDLKGLKPKKASKIIFTHTQKLLTF